MMTMHEGCEADDDETIRLLADAWEVDVISARFLLEVWRDEARRYEVRVSERSDAAGGPGAESGVETIHVFKFLGLKLEP